MGGIGAHLDRAVTHSMMSCIPTIICTTAMPMGLMGQLEEITRDLTWLPPNQWPLFSRLVLSESTAVHTHTRIHTHFNPQFPFHVDLKFLLKVYSMSGRLSLSVVPLLSQWGVYPDISRIIISTHQKRKWSPSPWRNSSLCVWMRGYWDSFGSLWCTSHRVRPPPHLSSQLSAMLIRTMNHVLCAWLPPTNMGISYRRGIV